MKIIVKNSKKEIAEEVSDIIINGVKENPRIILGLATGSTPIDTYKDIIEKAKEQKVDFSKVTTFNLDEYLDNPDETQSYRYFMDTHLFNGININKKNTHFPGIDNIGTYDEMIAKSGGIDIQILGIGRDGHIGFNEPGTPFDSKTHIAELKEETIKDNSRFFRSIDDVPTRAVTMGLDTILHARKVILIATGENKAEAIKSMSEKNDVNCPASILQKHQDALIYCDKEAAELINK